MKVRSKYKAKELYLLTPKLICGCCGAHMVGESGTSRNGTLYTYYKCIDKKKAHSQCPKRNEKKAELENAVIGLIEDHILTPDTIKEIAEEWEQQLLSCAEEYDRTHPAANGESMTEFFTEYFTHYWGRG